MLVSGQVTAQVHTAAEALHRVRRIWVVGTGTSQHAANLGAGDAAGRRPVGARRLVDAVREERADRRAPGRHRRHHPHGRDVVRARGARARRHRGAADGHHLPAGRRPQRRDRDRPEGALRDVHGELHDHVDRPRAARRGDGRRCAFRGPARARAGSRRAPPSRPRAPRVCLCRRGRCRSSGPAMRRSPRERARSRCARPRVCWRRATTRSSSCTAARCRSTATTTSWP